MPTTEIWQRIFCYMFAFSYSYLSTYRLSTHAFSFILYPSLCFSNHHTLGLFLDFFPIVTAPIYPWYQWSPKCWHSNCLLVYRKKVLELIFHNVSTGGKKEVKRLYYFRYTLAVTFLLVLYVRHALSKSVLREEWTWQPHPCRRHCEVLQFTCAQLSGFKDYVT